MHYSIALEDDLYAAFHDFKHGKPHDTHLVERLLTLYKPPHITNVSQLTRVGIEDASLRMQLSQAGLVNQTIEELAAKTAYKIILSADIDVFPRVNINERTLQNNYTITCGPGESRGNALLHIQALLADAKEVVICDRYMGINWESSKKIFDYFPNKGISIHFVHQLLQEYITEIKKIDSSWKIKPLHVNLYPAYHDRYLLIDRKMEILITSGIDYLFDNTKECTLLFRLNG